MSPKRTMALLACGVLFAPLRHAGAEGRPITEQVMVVKVGPKTTAALSHQRGDRIALLRVRHAPPGVLDALNGQRGHLISRATPKAIRGDELTLLLTLGDPQAQVELKLLPKPPSLVITARPGGAPLMPSPGRLLGRIPGLFERPPLPFALPQPPAEHPCAGVRGGPELLQTFEGRSAPPPPSRVVFAAARLPDPACASWVHARLAATLIQREVDTHPVERWAFSVVREPRWARWPVAQSYTFLVAAAVLVRAGLLPEAEILVADPRALRSPAQTPYVALTLANLHIAQRRGAEADAILARLIGGDRDPQRLRAALLSRALAGLDRDEPAAAQRALEEARGLLGAPNLEPLLLLGGEAALANGDPAAAGAFFGALESAASPQLAAAAHLRRCDLRVATAPVVNRPALAECYRAIRGGATPVPELVALRLAILEAGSPRELAVALEQIAEAGASVAERVEARLALAQLFAADGDFGTALVLLERSMAEPQLPWGAPSALRAAIKELAESTVGRLHRSEAWMELAELYESGLAPHLALLSAESLIAIAGAHLHLGLPERAIDVLLAAMRGPASEAERDAATLALARAYLDARDRYRAEVVLRYFETRRQRSPSRWEAQLLGAELRLAEGDAAGALTLLEAAGKSTPSGDGALTLATLRAEALARQDRADEAANALIPVLSAGETAVRPATLARVAVEVSSLCARRCSAPLLERLLKELGAFEDGALLSERIRHVAEKRGAGAPPAEASASVWSALSEVLNSGAAQSGAAER